MRVHVGLSRALWRIGPAWSVLAGALAGGAPLATADALLRLAAAMVLADLAWGMLREFVSAQPSTTEGEDRLSLPSVPYAQPVAPLVRFLRALAVGQGSGLSAWQGLFIGLVFAAVLSLLLSRFALVLSALAAGVVWLAWAFARRGDRPVLCQALLDVALPWLVGASLAWRDPGVPSLSEMWPVLVSAAAFTLLQWSLHCARLADGAPTGGIWLGQMAVLFTLVGLRQAWALGVTAALFAPPSWWLARRAEVGEMLAPSLPWWWAAMLVTATAVR